MFKPRKLLGFWRSWISMVAPVVLIAVPFSAEPQNEKAMWCAYSILVCASYWIFECAPLAITAMIPIVVLPLAGVLGTDSVCKNYLKGVNMMFLAGLIMAVAVEHCGLHSRIALNIIKAIGSSKRRLMLGFMVCSMFLSMWISNTAATAMMVPIVDAIQTAVNSSVEIELESKDRDAEKEETRKPMNSKTRNILLLAVAYASSIGGTGVITGSPPNLTVLSNLNKRFGEGTTPLSYATWMAFAVPLMLLNTLGTWGMLVAIEAYTSKGDMKPTKEDEEKIKAILDKKRQELGSMTWHEAQVLFLFVSLVLLWFFQQPYFIQGWADLEVLKKVSIGSATPAVLIVWLLFLLPSNPSLYQSSPALIDWNTVEKKLPWGVIMLLGGGFALAEATESSGLSEFISKRLANLASLGHWQINLLISIITTFVTEVASNTATANIVVPILMQISVSIGVNPIYMMLTSALCCSYAFMLPVATAPNAIVFSHSTLKTSEMMKCGFLLNVMCIITTNFAVNTWGRAIFGLDDYPTWALEGYTGDVISNVTSVGLDSFSNFTAVFLESFNNLTAEGLDSISNLTALGPDSFSNLTAVGLDSFSNLTAIGLDSFSNLAAEGLDSFSNLTAEGLDSFSNLTAVGLDSFSNLTAEGLDSFSNLTAVGLDSISNLTAVGLDSFSNLTAAGLDSFPPGPLAALANITNLF